MRPTRPVRPATALTAAVLAGALAAVGVPAAGAAAQRVTATPKTVNRTAIQTVRGSGWPVIEFCSRTIRVFVRSAAERRADRAASRDRQRPLRVPLGPQEQEHRTGRLDAGRASMRCESGENGSTHLRPGHDAHHHQLGGRHGDWDAGDIPDQTGRIAVVTGANSGLGLVTARELARARRARGHGMPQPRQGPGRAGGGGSRRDPGPSPSWRASTWRASSSVRSFAERFKREPRRTSTC